MVTLFMTLAAVERQLWRWAPVISGTLLVTSITWMVASSYQPAKVEIEEILPVKVVESPNGPMQIVVYKDRDGENRFLNFHKQFGCQATEDVRVRHTRFVRGPYCGIYYDNAHSLADKWEIVK